MKKFVSTLLAVAMMSFIVGCGESGDTKQPKLAGPPDPKIKGPAPLAPQPGEKGGGNKMGASDA